MASDNTIDEVPSEIIEFLRSGPVEKWNYWRRKNDGARIVIRNFSLRNPSSKLTAANLSKVDFVNTHFEGAHLAEADFKHSRFSNSHLTACDLTDADLRDAEFNWDPNSDFLVELRTVGVLEPPALQASNLVLFQRSENDVRITITSQSSETIYDTTLSQDNLPKSLRKLLRDLDDYWDKTSPKSILPKVLSALRLECDGGSLQLRRRLTIRKFFSSIFQKVLSHFMAGHRPAIPRSNITSADLRESTSLLLDENCLIRSRFSVGVKEPYLAMCRIYTGNNFIMILCFTLLSLMPYVIEGVFWNAISQFEETSYYESKTTLSGQPTERYRVFSMVVGWHDGIISVSMTVALVLYNALRGYVTIMINAQTAEETRSHSSPKWEEIDKLWFLHKILQVLFVFGIIAIAYKCGVFLSREVDIPDSISK